MADVKLARHLYYTVITNNECTMRAVNNICDQLPTATYISWNCVDITRTVSLYLSNLKKSIYEFDRCDIIPGGLIFAIGDEYKNSKNKKTSWFVLLTSSSITRFFFCESEK